MKWKKLLLIAAVSGAVAFASVPKSEAGVQVGVGIGLPIAYPAYGYPCYPYAYGYPYGYAPYYASYGYYPVVYRRPYVYSRPVVVYRNGRRVYRHRPR
ncbi:MAG: hypothetical protein WCE51_09880 [Chthoniobacterales bacterium]|jgi:hypothetical protein